MKVALLTRAKRHAPMAEMNMIPFIDISLVLLIIFMVMTPFLVQNEVKVNLPRSVTGTQTPDSPVIVVVRQGGMISLGGRAIRESDLRERIEREFSAKGSRTLLIQSDKTVPLETVIAVMDAARLSGVTKMGIAVTTDSGKR